MSAHSRKDNQRTIRNQKGRTMDDRMRAATCSRCATSCDPLEIFPGGVCLACWAASPQGRYLPTADELARAWGADR